MGIKYYENDIQYLADELRRLDLRLQIIQSHQSQSTGAEIHSSISSVAGIQNTQGAEGTLAALSEQISARVEASLRQGIVLALPRLVELFGLNAFEKDMLLGCLAVEIVPEKARLLAFPGGDAALRPVTIKGLCRLLGSGLEEQLKARQYFSCRSPLFKYRLLELEEDGQVSYSGCSVRISQRVVDFVCGMPGDESSISSFTDFIAPQRTLDELHYPDKLKEKLKFLGSVPEAFAGTIQKGLLFYFYGPHGVGKTAAAEALCAAWGLPLLVVRVEDLLHAGVDLPTAVTLIFRESLLQSAAICFERFDLLLHDEEKAAGCRQVLFSALRELSWLTILEGAGPWHPGVNLPGQLFWTVEFELPGYRLRQPIWEAALKQSGCGTDEISMPVLASRFNFSGGQIREAVHLARSLSTQNDPVNCRVGEGDLMAAAKLLSFQKLNGLATMTRPRFSLKDIVLPTWQVEQLKDIIARVEQWGVVYENWGFGRKFSEGRGLKALFTGPSGTGKTMAAEVIAGELQLDLYRVDLATVVSKYVGETEKNLARIFDAARCGNVVLFFDEADALFGRRTEVRDSHDRYANLETGYLLQKLEGHDGLVILATNWQKNMDEAFTRRLHFIVEFPLPSEEHRHRIWESIFPAQTPLDTDVDFKFLARQLKITGGNIKNIALDAAFLAVGLGEAVGMKHLLRAARREFQKLGKTMSEADFGKYAGLFDAE